MKYLFLIIAALISTNAKAEEESKEIEKALIPVKVELNGSMKIEAKLTSLKPEAEALGLRDLTLQGLKKVTPTNNGNEIEVIWNKAYLLDSTGQKIYTSLESNLYSDIIASPKLETGDEFTAEGAIESLLLAIQRLKEPTPEEKDEDEDDVVQAVQQTAPQPTAVQESQGLDDPRGYDYSAPEFEVTEEPVITNTTDGCPINVDIAQMAAIVQERVLQDGEEISECADTLTRYPITKTYSTCPLFFDTVNLIAYEQYILKYTDPNSGGSVEVQSCVQDDERVVTLTEDTQGCTMRHDFALDKSFLQSRIIYTHLGKVETFQTCMDTETEYAHITTEETCTPVVDQSGGVVTFQNRRKINVDGIDQFISLCQPDPSSTTSIEEEVCIAPKYTHDLLAGQSYLNKSYYYIKDGNRYDVENCIPSNETFTHKQDETQCSATHDDVIKKTTLNARTYIEESDGTVIYINQCTAIDPKVDYFRTGGKWRQINQAYNVPVTFTGSLGTVHSGTNWQDLFGCCIGNNVGVPDQWRSQSDVNVTTGHQVNNFNYNLCTIFTSSRAFACGRYFDMYGAEWCIKRDNSGSYNVYGIPVDTANSTSLPTIALTSRSVSSYRVDYGCSSICNILTTVEKNAVYTRGDNSEYIDITIAEDIKRLCGDGNNLIGTVEP
tara:strand:- start:17720 stop:19711 length:1992 start_codon:yes stop_codon:yes gene_type:complete